MKSVDPQALHLFCSLPSLSSVPLSPPFSCFTIEFQHIPNKPYYVQCNLHNLPAAAAEIELSLLPSQGFARACLLFTRESLSWARILCNMLKSKVNLSSASSTINLITHLWHVARGMCGTWGWWANKFELNKFGFVKRAYAMLSNGHRHFFDGTLKMLCH